MGVFVIFFIGVMLAAVGIAVWLAGYSAAQKTGLMAWIEDRKHKKLEAEIEQYYSLTDEQLRAKRRREWYESFDESFRKMNRYTKAKLAREKGMTIDQYKAYARDEWMKEAESTIEDLIRLR